MASQDAGDQPEIHNFADPLLKLILEDRQFDFIKQY